MAGLWPSSKLSGWQVAACRGAAPLAADSQKSSSEVACSGAEEVKLLSPVRLFVTPWTVAYQASLSMGFSRQEYWSGLPWPSPGDLPDPGIEPESPALQADALPSEPPGKPWCRRGVISTCKRGLLWREGTQLIITGRFVGGNMRELTTHYPSTPVIFCAFYRLASPGSGPPGLPFHLTLACSMCFGIHRPEFKFKHCHSLPPWAGYLTSLSHGQQVRGMWIIIELISWCCCEEQVNKMYQVPGRA